MAQMMPSNLGKKDIESLVQEATSAMLKGDVAAAHAVAERGIAAGAEHPFLLKVEALWLHTNGQYSDALRLFHHARTLAPDDPSILNGIAGCLAGMGEYDAAQKILDAALELTPSASATHYLRGWIFEAARDFQAARASYERALSLSPNFVEALAGLASVAAQIGDFETARARAKQTFALLPQQPTASIALAMAEIAQGEASIAEGRMRSLLNTPGQSNRERAMAWGVLGDSLDAQGRAAEALDARREKDEEFRRAAGLTEKLDAPES